MQECTVVAMVSLLCCVYMYRSTDYGRTFTNDTYKLNDPSVVISWYYVSPFDQYVSPQNTSVAVKSLLLILTQKTKTLHC